MRIIRQFRRDESPLKVPEMMGTGVTVNTQGGGVWAWMELPPHSTDELNTSKLIAMTQNGASDLRLLIPAGHEFHFKIQWGTHSGDDYREQELRDGMTQGARDYVEIGARAIDLNLFPKRQVLLGVRFDDAAPGRAAGMLGKAKSVAGTVDTTKDGVVALELVMRRVRSWQARMATSVFKARPAVVRQLAWSLRRDIRRTVGALPPGSLAGPGQMAQLTATSIVPRADHIQCETDTGVVFLRLLTTAENGFPADELELPGGEWLRNLNITSLPDDENHSDGAPVEVSIRGVNIPQADAIKRLKEALALAKEQDREARKGMAEEAPDSIAESAAVIKQRITELQKGQVGMIEDATTWVVEAASLELLEQRSQAVIDFYGGLGITVWAPPGIQDLLWKELIIGDGRRVKEFTQFRPWGTLVGAWFHGGSMVGHDRGPFLASIMGSTPGPFRNRITDAQREGKGITTVFAGATGFGKSTGVMLTLLAEAVMTRSWVGLTDFKGDLGGVCEVAEWFGVPVTRMSTADAASGSLCPFRYVPDPMEAASYVVDNLSMMLGGRDGVESTLRKAANRVAKYVGRTMSTAAVIQELVDSGDPFAKSLGDDLHDLAQDPLARPVAGFPVKDQKSHTGPGLVYMKFDSLRWPDPAQPQIGWKPGQRLSMMLVQAGIAYLMYMGSRVKGLPKLLGLTELHYLTRYSFGTQFIGATALTGRALDLNLLLDSQATARLLAVPDLVDNVTQVHCFGVNTDAEADAQAVMLGLEPEQSIRDGQQSLPQGRCLTLDRWKNIATTHFTYLTDEIEAALTTTPDRFEAVTGVDGDVAPIDELELEEVAS